MSASEQEEMMCKCIQGGAEEYLVKPGEATTLFDLKNPWSW